MNQRCQATNQTGAVCEEAAAAAARLLNRRPEDRRKVAAANSKQPGRRIHLQRAALIQVLARPYMHPVYDHVGGGVDRPSVVPP
jgi:hypothetical protein